MASIGFVNPWFLVGLPLASLPVVIHFLTRARPRTIKFPTMRFLREAGGGMQALHRLRLIVLLALRCLAILCAVLVFARPYVSSPGVEDVPGAKRRAVLIVDASMSMCASRGGVSLFSKARAEAAEVLGSMEGESEAAVVFMGASARSVLPALSRNMAELHKALADAKPTLELGRAEPALAMAKRLLASQGEGGAVYVFSDFQRTNWSAAPLDVLSGHAVFLRPVTEAAVPNVAITSVAVSPEEPVAGESAELVCTVFNCTGSSRRQGVSLLVEGEGIAMDASASLKPFSSADVSFQIALAKAGEFPGAVSLSSDDLPEDDVRYFSIRVREALNGLVVSDSGFEDKTSAAFFVSTALSPSTDAGTGLMVERRNSQDVDQATVNRADVIVVAAPASLPGRVAEAIAERVIGGADLIVCLDGTTSPAILGALSGASGGSVSAPFRILGPAAPAGPDGARQPLGRADLASGVLTAFVDAQQGDLSQLEFARHHRTEMLPDRGGEVLVYHRDGSVALALSAASRGQAVFMNMPLTMEGGNLVGRGMFPALMAELVRALRRGGARPEARPGENWFVDIPAGGAADDAEFRVVSADLAAEIPHSVVARGRTVRLALAPVAAAGHYRVHAKGAERALGAGVVNVDPKESDTREMPLALASEAAGDVAVAVIDDEGTLAVAGTARPAWPALLALAAIFICAEMLLLALWKRPTRQVSQQRFVRGTV